MTTTLRFVKVRGAQGVRHLNAIHPDGRITTIGYLHAGHKGICASTAISAQGFVRALTLRTRQEAEQWLLQAAASLRLITYEQSQSL